MILKFYFLIVRSFCIISLCLLGCSSSNVEDEAPESPIGQEDGFGGAGGESPDEYGDAEEFVDELELEEGETIAEGLPEDPPTLDGSEPSTLPSLPEAAPLASEEGSGVDNQGLPESPVSGVTGTPSDLSSLSSLDTTGGSDFSGPVVPQRIPVKKIKSYPYRRAGALVNAVYIARSGDDLSLISQKIFGTDRTAELLAINPNLQRGVDVGDKVYYNSPNRPNDSDNLLFYYEDIGMQSQQYNVARNDNIRDLAEQFFGERESWKELWATNSQVESKWNLPEGIVLRYWASNSNVSVPSPPPVEEEVVQEDVPLPAPEEEVPDLAGDTTSGEIPPSQPSEDPNVSEDEPPPFPDTADSEVPPPPPMPPDLSSELPPPPPLGMSEQPPEGAGGLLEDDTSLMILVVGVVIVMFVLLIAIRKKSRRRRIQVDMGDTQI